MIKNENWRETAGLTSLHSIDVFFNCSFPSLACVADVRKGRESGSETVHERGGRKGTPASKPLFLPFRLLISKNNATVSAISCAREEGGGECLQASHCFCHPAY